MRSKLAAAGTILLAVLGFWQLHAFVGPLLAIAAFLLLWAAHDWLSDPARNSRVTRAPLVATLILALPVVYLVYKVPLWLDAATGRGSAQLRFYCGQKDITGSASEIEALWIPSDAVAVPEVWIVNVGTGDAVNVTGRLDVKEDLVQLPMTGDKEYPHSVPWSFPLLHRNDLQIIYGPNSWTRERLAKISVKMEARYNGPTAVAEFVVRLKPIPGPSYPPGYLPCPRPRKD